MSKEVKKKKKIILVIPSIQIWNRWRNWKVTNKNINSVKHLKEFNQSFLPIKIVNSTMNSTTNFINISRSIHAIIIKSNIFYKTFVRDWRCGFKSNQIQTLFRIKFHNIIGLQISACYPHWKRKIE